MTRTFEQWAESEGLDMSVDWKGELASPVTAGALRGWEAAQSAGQEAFAWATHHDEPMLFLGRDEAAQYCEDDEQPIPLYAAPVNGGERETVEVAVALEQQRTLAIVKAVRDISFGESPTGMPTAASAAYDLACEEIERRLRTEQWTLDGVPAPLLAADAPQVGGDEREAFDRCYTRMDEIARTRMAGDDWYELDPDERSTYRAFFHAGATWQARAALSADGGEGCTPADVTMLRFANHSLENVVDEYRTALGELVDQIEKFAEEHGEAAFETGRALRLLNGLPPAEKVSADGGDLDAEQVEWVVNDNAELGVKIGQQFFWLYKGTSLVYEEATHDDGSPMHWRHVFKREFGECAHPINYDDPALIGTVSLDDSEDWERLPAAIAAQAKGEAE